MGTCTLNPFPFCIPMFRFDIVSGRDKRALVPIVIISNIKDSSSLLGNVLGLNIWYIFCDGIISIAFVLQIYESYLK